MRFGRQTSKFSEIVWKCQMTVPAVVVLVEGRSTGGDWRMRYVLTYALPVAQLTHQSTERQSKEHAILALL